MPRAASTMEALGDGLIFLFLLGFNVFGALCISMVLQMIIL